MHPNGVAALSWFVFLHAVLIFSLSYKSLKIRISGFC